MTIDLHGVRVGPDGTLTDITVPAAGLNVFAAGQLGGGVDFARYGRPGSAVTVVVHETGMLDGLPVNRLATTFVSLLRGGPLSYSLHGPALVFGFDGREDVTSLPDELRGQLYTLAEIVPGGGGRG